MRITACRCRAVARTRIDNILPSCRSCNLRKHTLTEAEFRTRLAAEKGRQPPYN
jgi:hypothetical protein